MHPILVSIRYKFSAKFTIYLSTKANLNSSLKEDNYKDKNESK